LEAGNQHFTFVAEGTGGAEWMMIGRAYANKFNFLNQAQKCAKNADSHNI